MRRILIVLMVLAVASMAVAKVSDGKVEQTRGLLDCSAAIPINCGTVDLPGTTIGAASNVSSYSCNSWNESGPEVVYELVIPAEECYEVSVTITPDGCDLDVYFLGSCDENDCLTYGDSSLSTSCLEEGTYYIVVDGYNGAECAFTITVTCDACACPEPCPDEQNALPFYEGFEREECFPPAGWTILNLGDDPAGVSWGWDDNSYYVCDGLGTAKCSYGGSSEYQDEWLVTPIIYLEGATSINISFQHSMAIWGDCTHPMQVLYSTTGTDPADFTLRLDYTCDLPDPLCGTSVLPVEGLGDHIYVAWRYQGLWAGNWYVDNVVIEAQVSPVEESSWGSIKALYR
ncbi:choice-of-anchor J domain-containing protein [bacterium]|nr:choice-of-anchor J domain-containing protein [bacterium]